MLKTTLTSMVASPVRSLAEYLLDRFLGKFVHRIDLRKEGTDFSKANSTLTLPDLNLDCRVRIRFSHQPTNLMFTFSRC